MTDLNKQALEAVTAFGSQSKAAEALGIARTTLQSRLYKAVFSQPQNEQKSVEFPEFVTIGDEDEPISQVIDRQVKSFERKYKAAKERRWFPIKINEEKPYGLITFGDPHLDNGGCNWPLLQRHIEIANQPGVYAANIGDTTDNWPWTGRLAKLWSESDVSNKTAKRLAEWFMFDAGIKWLVWLIGNHDAWNSGDEFYKRLGATHVPVSDWRAQFRLVHKNGSEVRIDAAHGRKGNSIYNPTHGTLRDAKFGEDADLWLTGHIHSFKLDHFEIADRKTVTWLAQVRGYKFSDAFSWVNGFPEYENGSAIMAIIDPVTAKVQCFADVEEGADYLAFKRR